MDSTSADEVSEITAYIAALDFYAVQLYCTASIIALLGYHYITTLDAEYTHFWAKRRFGVAWALFLANRYLPLVTYIYQAPWWPVSNDPSVSDIARLICAATVISQYILEFSQYALWGAISCLRVHALGKSRPLALLVLVLALVPVATDIVLLVYIRPAIDPTTGCYLDSSRVPFEMYEMYAAHARSPLPPLLTPTLFYAYSIDVLAYTAWVLSEVLVVGVTLAATRHHKSLAGALGRGQRSLSAVLFRNGLIYFVTIMVLNIAQLIVNVVSITHPSTEIQHAASVLSFIAPLTSILLTRFYIDLQETAYPPQRSVGAGASTDSLSDLHFSLGARDLDLQIAEPEADPGGPPGSSISSNPGGSDLRNHVDVHLVDAAAVR